MTAYTIREGSDDDAAAIARLYPAAFPEEDLLALVRALTHETPGVTSLVAFGASDLIAHAIFTPCRVDGARAALALLGPVAVTPAWQRQGVGRALIRDGLARLRAAGVARVCVLGDPAYYRALGFGPERSVDPPFPLPAGWEDAWQSLPLNQSAVAGRLQVPPAWQDPALWGA